jgi:hypothetical protein
MKTRKEKINFLKDIKAGGKYCHLALLDHLTDEELLTEIRFFFRAIVEIYSINDDEHFRVNIRNVLGSETEITELISPRVCELMQPFVFNVRIIELYKVIKPFVLSKDQKDIKLKKLRDLLITFKYRWSLNAREKQMLPGSDMRVYGWKRQSNKQIN